MIAEQEIEDLGVFRADEPADFVGLHIQLLKLAELAVGLGFALQEEQDRLALVASGLVKDIPDFAGLRRTRRDRPDGISGSSRPGPRSVAAATWAWAGPFAACSVVGRTAAAGLAARHEGSRRSHPVIVVIVDRHRATARRRRHRSPPGPWARCPAASFLRGADPLGVGGQNRCPNMLADRMFFIVGASAADGQLLAAESPVQDHVVLGLAMDMARNSLGRRERKVTRPWR